MSEGDVSIVVCVCLSMSSLDVSGGGVRVCVCVRSIAYETFERCNLPQVEDLNKLANISTHAYYQPHSLI